MTRIRAFSGSLRAIVGKVHGTDASELTTIGAFGNKEGLGSALFLCPFAWEEMGSTWRSVPFAHSCSIPL